MASRNYSSTAGKMALVGAISAASTTIIVSVTTGLPGALPYVLMIDPGLPTEEIVDVTAAGGTTLTVSRGVDSTPAQSHLTGAEVRHAYSARDFRESREHEANTLAHGATGAVVGTSNAQTFTNKAIDGATNTVTNLQKTSLPSDVVYAGAAAVLTGKTIDGAANTITNVPRTAIDPQVAFKDAANAWPAAQTFAALATFSAGVTGTTGAFTGAVNGTTGTFTGNITAANFSPAVSTKNVTSVSGIVGEVVCVTAPAVTGNGTKRFKISASFYALSGTVPGDVFTYYLKDSTSGVVIGQFRSAIPASWAYADGRTMCISDAPSAGSHAYQLTCARVGGSGTGQIIAGSVNPIEIIVEQIA